MASPPPNPKAEEEGGSEFTEESSGQNPTAPQKSYVPPPASQLPTKLQYVARGAPGPSGIKQCFRTVKAARRVPTLPHKPSLEPSSSGAASVPETGRKPRRDRNKRHVCSTCDKRFSTPTKLSQHMLAHTGELPFSCELCDKKFNSKFKLVRHNLIHSEAKAFACTVCGKTFNRKDHLTNHVRVHNPVKKLFTCERPDCRKSYTSLLSYRKHAALHSAEEGNLQCEICDDVFDTREDIIYHLKVHTGSRTVKNETDKKFTCDYCDRRFFTAKDVRRHLVVHTGRRDFVCLFCPQKFGRKDHLVRHVKNAHADRSMKPVATSTAATPSTSTDVKVEAQPETSLASASLLAGIPGTSYEIWKSKPEDSGLWKEDSQERTSESGRTRVPSSDIIVEMPSDLDIKVEPLDIDIKLEQPTSPTEELLTEEYPVVYMGTPYPQQSNLPFIQTAPLTNPIDVDILDPLLLDPGEGPSRLSQQILELLEEPNLTEESQRPAVPQRLPAFKQAFHSTQGSKQPPPPPAP